jgi:NADH-quinone oxidoreductase subunit N
LSQFLQIDQAVEIRRLIDFLPLFYGQYALVLGIIALILTAICYKETPHYLPTLVFLASLAGALFFPQGKITLHPLFGTSEYAYFFQLLTLASGALVCFLIEYSKLGASDKKSELYTLVLFSVLGMSFLSISSNLFSIFLGLECMTIPSYCLAAFGFSGKSTEAATKYVIYGSASAAIMLFGMSLLYGLSGTLEVDKLGLFLNAPHSSSLITMALVLMLMGFFFKIAAFPFHAWAPDVYEGAPTPLVAFFSIAPKALAFCVLIRLVTLLESHSVQLVLVAVSITSMTIGNLLALGQTNSKRLLAYSSVSHAGFLLMSIASGRHFGFDAVIYYLCIYLLMNFSAFHLLQVVAKWKESEDIESFSGLGKSNPYLATSLLITMISLTGLPPAAGFSAKLFMFTGVYEAYKAHQDPGLLAMLVVALINTVLSLFYYLKMPFYAFFRGNGENTALVLSNSEKAFILTLNALLLLFFFKPDWVFVIIKLTKLEG